jgi:hypothetical protein
MAERRNKTWLAGTVLACATLILVLTPSCRNKDNDDSDDSSFFPKKDEILDNPLLDRKIAETPRQKALRACELECQSFAVKCTFCHTTGDQVKIIAPESLLFTDKGKRAQIMCHSPAFGLNQQCKTCHLSGFRLNNFAQSQLLEENPRGDLKPAP